MPGFSENRCLFFCFAGIMGFVALLLFFIPPINFVALKYYETPLWPLHVVFLDLVFHLSSVHSIDNNVTDKSFKEEVLDKLRSLTERVVHLEQKLAEKDLERRSKRDATFFPENEVAFYAQVSQHLKNLNAHQTIVFDRTVTNSGNFYNKTTGVFFVPISGTYQFFVNILSEADNNIEAEIVANGRVLASIYSGAGRFHGAGSNLVIVHLNKGDNVWVKVHAAFSSDMAVHCCWSTFSGFLLREQGDPTQIVG